MGCKVFEVMWPDEYGPEWINENEMMKYVETSTPRHCVSVREISSWEERATTNDTDAIQRTYREAWKKLEALDMARAEEQASWLQTFPQEQS